MALVTKILCPTDFSDPANRAIEYALQLATLFGASITLLHVVQPTVYPLRNLASVAGFPNLRDEIRKSVDQELASLRQKIGGKVAITAMVREGVPHDQILAAGEELGCDLIVMATHGHTGLKHMLLGSTAERVVRLAPMPVLTVRSREA